MKKSLFVKFFILSCLFFFNFSCSNVLSDLKAYVQDYNDYENELHKYDGYSSFLDYLDAYLASLSKEDWLSSI